MRMRTKTREGALGLLLAAGLAGCGGPAAGPVKANEVIAHRVSGELPRQDPDAAAWGAAPEVWVKLLVQDQAPPKLDTPSVELVRVRALHDEKWIAFRLEWEDPSADELVTAARFGDMAAVQVPTEAGADVPDGAMGQLGRPVRITLWRASKDHFLRTGMDPITALYPNALPDHYPAHAAKEGRAAMEVQYSPARSVKNPVTVGRAESATEDLLAEGFGSLTSSDTQVSLGKGVHDGKVWRVVIARPFDAKQGQALVVGGRTYSAFAVWQGAANNVGSRKMRSGWVPLSIEVK